jgi:hypothetical protein
MTKWAGEGWGEENDLLRFPRLPNDKCPYTKTDIFKTALVYSEIHPVSVHYKSVMFYNTGPRSLYQKDLYCHHCFCTIVS